MSSGTNQNIDIQTTRTDKTIAKLRQDDALVESKRLVQNQAAELARARARASGIKGRLMASEGSDQQAAGRLFGQHSGRAQCLQTNRRAVAQPAETGPGQHQAPAGRHQVGRGAGLDGHRRGGQRSRQGVGPARR